MPETPRPDNSLSRKKDITDNSADFEFEPLPVAPLATTAVNYTRRIKLLMAAIVVGIMAYTGAWFWAGDKLVTVTNAAISDAALKGQTITCAEPTAKGYPFRMGLTCSKTGFADPAQGLKIEAGAFRSAAQVYQPGHIIGELDGPLAVNAAPLNPFTVSWALAHASFSGSVGLPQRVSVEIEKPVFTETALPAFQLGGANLAAFHMRQGENNQVDLASIIEAAKIKEAPVFNFSSDAAISGATRFDAAIKSQRPLIDVLRGNDGQLRNVNLAFVDGGNVTISGPFSISTAGLLSATLSIKAGKANALIDNLGKLSLAFGASVTNLDVLKAMAINDQFNLTVTIKDGNASIGFIPLGSIPAL
jgi:hypothetical protein